jgi:hypothetical protein
MHAQEGVADSELQKILQSKTGNLVIDLGSSAAKAALAYTVATRLLADLPVREAYLMAGVATGVSISSQEGDRPIYQSGLLSLVAGAQLAALLRVFPEARSLWPTSKMTGVALGVSAVELGLFKGVLPGLDMMSSRDQRVGEIERTWCAESSSGLVNLLATTAQFGATLYAMSLLREHFGDTKMLFAAFGVGFVGGNTWPRSSREVKILFPPGLVMGLGVAATFLSGNAVRQVWGARAEMGRGMLSLQLTGGAAATLLSSLLVRNHFRGGVYGRLPRRISNEIDQIWSGKGPTTDAKFLIGALQGYCAETAVILLTERYGLAKVGIATTLGATSLIAWRMKKAADSGDDRPRFLAPDGLLVGMSVTATHLLLRSFRHTWGSRADMDRLMWSAQFFGTGVAAMMSSFVVAGSLLVANRDDGGKMKKAGRPKRV